MNTSKMLFPYYWTFSQIMVASWFIGLFIDVSIDFGDPQGFWTLRVQILLERYAYSEIGGTFILI